jgi:REP element-mobilizing transposase RayT
MGRAPRIIEPGRAYHLTAHGVDDRPIFVDDTDRQSFALRLRRIAVREGWTLYAACLMDTHYHLLVRPSRDLAGGMRVLNGSHSRTFNARHDRRGALFESRYFDRTNRDEEHLVGAIEYVENNPVEAGMVDHPGEWPWSTYEGCALRSLLAVCFTREW